MTRRIADFHGYETDQQLSICGDIIQRLKQLLANGQYRPGDRLPAERKLAEQLGVGRNTLREAQQTLALIGVLNRRVGSGTSIAPDGANVLKQPFDFLLMLDHATIGDLFEARELVEVHLAGCAAERRTEEDLGRIEHVLRVYMKFDRSGTNESAAWNRDYHKAVAHAAHNPVLARFVEVVLDARSAYIESLRPESDRWEGWIVTHETHERIYEAIRDGNVLAARRAMALDMAMADEIWKYIQAQVRESAETATITAEATGAAVP